MVEKDGADATFCGMGGGWMGLKIFLPNWKTFLAEGEKKRRFFFPETAKLT